jgi:hypothetical protein
MFRQLRLKLLMQLPVAQLALSEITRFDLTCHVIHVALIKFGGCSNLSTSFYMAR